MDDILFVRISELALAQETATNISVCDTFISSKDLSYNNPSRITISNLSNIDVDPVSNGV